MKKCKDLTGVRFGRLVVLEQAEHSKHGQIRWRCKCDCGNEKITLGMSLKNGQTKSCGCYNKELISKRSIKDLTNQRFGRLTAIEICGRTLKQRCIWLCKCDCGEMVKVKSADLICGNTKSCGCYWRDVMRKPFGEAAFNSLYGLYSRQAKRRGYIFELSKDDFNKLIFADCHYCGRPPMQQHITDCNGYNLYNGIDRVDNTKGYTADNVVTCCGRCNRAKLNNSIDEFKEWIKSLYEHMHLANYTI